MGILKNQIGSTLGLQGVTPEKRAGASQINDIHYSAKSKDHVGGHTELNLDTKPTKYIDNLPE